MINQQQLEYLFRRADKYNGVAVLFQYNKGKGKPNISTKRYVGIAKYATPGIQGDYYMNVFGYESILPTMIMKPVGGGWLGVQDVMPELSFAPMGLILMENWFDVRNPAPHIKHQQYNYYFEKALYPVVTRYTTPEECEWLEGVAHKYQHDGEMPTSSGGKTDWSKSKVIAF